jgi:signal transduction histidine kinase
MNNILQSIVSSADFYKTFRDKPEMLAKLGDISDVINQHAKRGADLISNVRKLSRLEDSEIVLKPIKLSQMINKSIEDTTSGFQEKNVNIQVNSLTEGLMVTGNELLIDVFDNILDNAVKYNYNEQDISVEIDISKIRENDTSYVKVEIKDHGMGVPDKRKETLFNKARDTDVSRRGMGMGLSLVKTIIDKYEGKIKVQDRVEGDYEKGANFIVLLKEA